MSTTALALANDAALTSPVDPYRPSGFSQAIEVARTFHASGLVPGATSPEHVLYLMATGHELGLSPTQAVRGLFVFQGRVGLNADTMVAIVRRSRHCQRWRVVESTDRVCTIETQRLGDPEPVSMTWTIEQAEKAGYTKRNSNWQAIPRTMLYHRCCAFLARQVYPDLILGLYDRGELVDAGGAPVEPAPRPVAVRQAPAEAEVVELPAVPWQQQVAEATSLDQLKQVWSGLSRSEREAAREAFTARRKALEAPPAVEEPMREPGDESENEAVAAEQVAS